MFFPKRWPRNTTRARSRAVCHLMGVVFLVQFYPDGAKQNTVVKLQQQLEILRSTKKRVPWRTWLMQRQQSRTLCMNESTVSINAIVISFREEGGERGRG